MSKIHHYTIDEFNGNNLIATQTKKQMVEKKISLLHDFLMLEKDDDREPLVESVLSQCNTEEEMSRAIHDVLVYRETIDEFLARKGVM